MHTIKINEDVFNQLPLPLTFKGTFRYRLRGQISYQSLGHSVGYCQLESFGIDPAHVDQLAQDPHGLQHPTPTLKAMFQCWVGLIPYARRRSFLQGLIAGRQRAVREAARRARWRLAVLITVLKQNPADYEQVA